MNFSVKVNFSKFISLLYVVVSELLIDSCSRYLLHPGSLVSVVLCLVIAYSWVWVWFGLVWFSVECVNDPFVQFWRY